MTRFDPNNHEKYYKNWKDGGMQLAGVNPESADLIREYVADMELGTNINPSSKKGSRSFGRLRNLKAKMQTMTILMQTDMGIVSLKDLEERELDVLKFFKKMRDGLIMCRKMRAEPLRAVGTYCRAFKSFWHWYMRSRRKQRIEIREITQDLDATSPKPKFCYFTIDQLQRMCDEARYDYKVMMMFMFDSGIRAPTELMNVKVSDLEWNIKQNFYTLTIREETSKTFGRKIKLLLCSQMLKGFIESQKYEPDNYIFQYKPSKANQYIKYLGYKLLNIGTPREETINGRKFIRVTDGLSMYDFRHSSACYWLPRYKSESAMKYRFGWKKSDMIFYYTELLGMRDSIETDDLYIDVTKTELEQEITQKGRQIEMMEDKIKEQDEKMLEIMQVIRAMQLEKQLEQKIIIIDTPER
jgi:integrase